MSYADLRSQFLELDIQLRAAAVMCTQSTLVEVLVIVVERTIMTYRDGELTEEPMLRMPRKGKEKASCGGLQLVEGKEKLALLSGKTLFTRQQVHCFPLPAC